MWYLQQCYNELESRPYLPSKNHCIGSIVQTSRGAIYNVKSSPPLIFVPILLLLFCVCIIRGVRVTRLCVHHHENLISPEKVEKKPFHFSLRDQNTILWLCTLRSVVMTMTIILYYLLLLSSSSSFVYTQLKQRDINYFIMI